MRNAPTAFLLLLIAACSSDTSADGDGDPVFDASVSAEDGGLGTSGSSGSSKDAGADGKATSDAAAPTDGGKAVRPGACVPATATPTPDTQIARPKGTTCAKLGYYEYVPANYATTSNLPLILAFHGDGERGNGTSDLSLLLNNGLTKNIKDGKWDPGKRFVVLSPQMEDRMQPNERSGSSVNDFVAFAKANYDIDVKRIYLTGLSGGGAPVYNYLGDYKGGEVAAVSPMAGWYSTQGKECSWKQIPVWYFHSALDNVVPPAQHSTPSFNTLSACPQAAPVAPRYTMYKNLGHSAWAPTYDLTGMNAATFPLVASAPGTTPYNQSLYDWFLQYTR